MTFLMMLSNVNRTQTPQDAGFVFDEFLIFEIMFKLYLKIDCNEKDGNKKFYLINFKGVFETWIKHSLPVCAARTTTVSPGRILILNV